MGRRHREGRARHAAPGGHGARPATSRPARRVEAPAPGEGPAVERGPLDSAPVEPEVAEPLGRAVVDLGVRAADAPVLEPSRPIDAAEPLGVAAAGTAGPAGANPADGGEAGTNGARTGSLAASGPTPAGATRFAAPGPIATTATVPSRPGGCTPAQLRRFIKSRPYIPLHELRRRFAIDGGEDDVTPIDVAGRTTYVGLPTEEGRILADLVRQGEVGCELAVDPDSPVVVGVYPMRPVPRA